MIKESLSLRGAVLTENHVKSYEKHAKPSLFPSLTPYQTNSIMQNSHRIHAIFTHKTLRLCYT